MKKLILFFLLLLLCGCNNKIKLSDNYQSAENLIEIDNKMLLDLEKSKESFVLFISLPSCPTSSEFRKLLEKFLEKENLSFYHIISTQIDNSKASDAVKYFPTVIIYDKGKIKTYLKADSEKDEKYYKSLDEFSKWFSKYVSLD